MGRYHQPLLKVLLLGLSIPAGAWCISFSGVFDGVTDGDTTTGVVSSGFETLFPLLPHPTNNQCYQLQLQM